MICPGYRDETSLFFRNLDLSSFQKQRRTGRSMKLLNDQPGSTVGESDPDDRRYSRLPVELPQIWSQHVIPLILDKFPIALEDSIFTTVNRMVSMTQQGSPIYAVCNAVACAYRASITGSPNAMSIMGRAYGSALRTVHTALNDPMESKEDSTLLAVWLFVVYEVFKSFYHLVLSSNC